MTNVHDVFYPSETRTHSLVKAGEYFVSPDNVQDVVECSLKSEIVNRNI